jgi:hypothetical protein
MIHRITGDAIAAGGAKMRDLWERFKNVKFSPVENKRGGQKATPLQMT